MNTGAAAPRAAFCSQLLHTPSWTRPVGVTSRTTEQVTWTERGWRDEELLME